MRLLLAAALLLPTAAAAGPTLALRAGYAFAFGEAAKGTAIDEVARSQFPFQLDAMWRFTDRFAAGPYFSYGPGLLDGAVSDRCDGLAADCSVATIRVGVQGTYLLPQLANDRILPWAGAGIGYEWVREHVSAEGFSTTQQVSGWELFNVQAGADVAIGASKFAVGPYLLLSFGRYSSVDGNDVAEKGWHEWLHLGVRAKVDF